MPNALTSQDTVDVAVVGAGIAGLTVAFDCARAGLSVRVYEDTPAVGGLVKREPVGSLGLDVGAESFATRGGAVTALLLELGLDSAIVEPFSVGAHLLIPVGGGSSRRVRIPRASVLGIPAHPFARDVREVIGWVGSLRASADRFLPKGYGFRHSSVADVVTARMGKRVLTRLVAPICLGIHSSSPSLLELDAVAPGLRKDARTRGSLQLAVREKATGIRSGSAVRGLDGGMSTLAESLAAAIRSAGGEISLGTGVTRIEEAGNGSRLLIHSHSRGLGTAVAEEVQSARAVVVATQLPNALRLVDPLLGEDAPGPSPSSTESVEILTMVLRAPALDSFPAGTGVIVAPGVRGVQAKALTHSTAKWPWLRFKTAPHEHVVRLSYQLPAGADQPVDDDAAAERRALHDASAIIGVAESELHPMAFHRTVWKDAVTPPSPEHKRWLDVWNAQAGAHDRITVVGAWVSGTGLASVVPHARQAAHKIIHRLQPPGTIVNRKESDNGNRSGKNGASRHTGGQ